jgi:hypothetical protein
LNVGHVSREWEILSSGHWDGAMGGGNDKIRKGAINSWMFNHKIEYIFHETWLKPENCKRMPDVVDNCPADVQKPENRHILVSLTDGYAYNINTQKLCKLTDADMLEEQIKKTYMKDYPAVIKAANGYSDEEWERVYRSADGGFGRTSCTSDNDPDHSRCKNDGEVGPDGLLNKYNEDVMLDRADYCESCRKIVVQNFFDTGENRTVVECRLPEEEEAEIRSKTNQDTWEMDRRFTEIPKD